MISYSYFVWGTFLDIKDFIFLDEGRNAGPGWGILPHLQDLGQARAVLETQ